MTTRTGTAREECLAPVHPGEILLYEILEPMGLRQYALAKAIGVPPQRIGEIVHGRRAVTAETAMRLGRYFGMDPRSGSTCRLFTTWMSPRIRWATGSSAR